MKTGSTHRDLQTLAKLFFELVEEERGRVESYIDGDLAGVEASQAREQSLMSEVRSLLAGFREQPDSGPDSLGGALATGDLRSLREALAELKCLLHRNNRFLQISMSHSDLLLQALLGGRSRYDGEGMVHSSQGGLKGGGIRV